MGRHALLIASGEYSDQTLNRLRAPAQDVGRLSALLEDPDIGGFDSVKVLSDAPDHVIRRAIEDAAATRLRGDLLLVYFSCHGVVDRLGRLHFASTDTDVTRPASTAVSNSFLNEQMESSLASAKVLVLDCCYSGAFAEGFKSGEGAALDGRVGQGYVVLSACDRYEFALEGTDVVEVEERASLFTDVMVEGISSGNADLDGDGKIEVFELFRYVSEGVLARAPQQTPRSWSASAGPDIHVAKVPNRSVATLRTTPLTRATRPPVINNYRRNHAILARGMRASTDLIRRTMGPVGRLTIFVDETGHNVELGDARAVAARFQPDDPRDRLGASHIAQLVEEVYATAGGHAATAAVLAQAMTDAAAAALRNGATPVSLARQINEAVGVAIELLTGMTQPRGFGDKGLRPLSLATADQEIANAVSSYLYYDILRVEESNTLTVEIEPAKGTWLAVGFVSPYFVTDEARMEAVLDDPYVLVLTGRLATVGPLVPLLEKVMQTGRPLAVFARQVAGEALSTLVVNKIRATFKSVAVQIPADTAPLRDLAVLTSARLIESESLLDQVEISMLGQARKIVVGVHRTEVIGVPVTNEQVLRYFDQLVAETPGSDVPSLERSGRLDRFLADVATLKVGAPNEAALKERTAEAERLIRFGRHLREGVVPGGGVALCHVSEQMTLNARPDDPGAAIVAEALAAPIAQLLENAEIPSTPVTRQGFDALTGRTGPMAELGIMDSAGALTVSLRAAAQVVQRFLLTS